MSRKSHADRSSAREEKRLQALKDYAILDSEREESFDDLAHLASHICETPVALVSLVASDHQWFKAKVGIDIDRTPLDVSFCAHAIKGDGLFVVPDATKDERFASNPLVTGDHNVRFYAGAPLVTRDGHSLGTLCVLDRTPRELGEAQRAALLALGRQVVSQLELRRTAASNASLCVKAQRDARRRARQALRDPLTGLPNRACLATHLERSLNKVHQVEAAAPRSASAILMIDLDSFKQVNDTLGHGAGDEVLRRVGRRLRVGVRTRHRAGNVRGNDVVARMGGDEFTILLNDLERPGDAETIANRLIAALSQPFEIDGHGVRIGASVGIAVIEPRHASGDEVIREADTALYDAKRTGTGRSSTFGVAMHLASLREIRLERDMRDVFADGPHAATAGGFFLQYQPIVDVKSGAPTGFEALARWHHPEYGDVTPGEFIPIAESTGLIVQLGSWVLSQACAQLARWSRRDARFKGLSMSVNVARRQLLDIDLVAHVAGLLYHHDIEPSRLKLEITESTIMRDPDTASDALARLRCLGVALYMDDFGTGHSSLSCLKRYALDGLKIDRSFVNAMAERAESDAIVRAVMELSRCFNLRVTAEGVETSEQWWLLRKFGCHHAQGYFFSKPLDADAVLSYVKAQSGQKLAA